MAKHTPGPWRSDSPYVSAPSGEHRKIVADCDRYFSDDECEYLSDDECEANIRLIAAAPELLAALEAVLLFYRGDWWDEGERQEWSRLAGTQEATTKVLCDVVRAALAKARGVADPTSEDEGRPA